ncbi:MAG: signal peptidase I [Clostridia bacterium]|nr:signal peptidase I [Clostridia bacterium]
MRNKWFLIPLINFVLVIVLFKFVIYLGYVPTNSMEPTIMAGEKIFGSRIIGKLEVGDVVIFEYESRYLVKRIAAVCGEEIQGGGIVPDNCYYVLGDNSEDSYDSRYWKNQFIHRDQIIARVFTMKRPSVELKNYRRPLFVLSRCGKNDYIIKHS